MRIMVFDVPAVDGGALSVLKYFETEVKQHYSEEVEWVFVTSEPSIVEERNVTNLRFPWVKKSWFHRLFFDYIVSPRMIKKYQIDKIVSLQNTIIPRTSVEQYVYLHQPLPFTNIRFSLLKNWKFWIYQNLIARLIFRSVKRANKVFVQTEWIKKACIEKVGVDAKKVEIIPPKIDVDVKEYFQLTKESASTFFFPASAYEYKNHALIIEACKQINKEYAGRYKVIFTISENENDQTREFGRIVKEYNLPVVFHGPMSREEVFSQYARSVLIFPSYIETFGLPLLEAKLHNDVILASDCEFSHEILDEYENAFFFDPFNENDLGQLMSHSISKKLHFNPKSSFKTEKYNEISLINVILY